MGFQIGDQVEICSKEDGFLGSYYAARIIGLVGNNNENKQTLYVVEYETLLKADKSGPLVEVVPAREVRPMPPETPPVVNGFMLYDEVDAFDKDGWWVGKVTGRNKLGKVLVYFDIWKVEIAYKLSKLRFHQEWCNGKWLSSKNRVQ